MARHGSGFARFLDGLDGHARHVRTIGLLSDEGMTPRTAALGLDVLVPDEAAAAAVVADWHDAISPSPATASRSRLRVASGPFAERLLDALDWRVASDRFDLLRDGRPDGAFRSESDSSAREETGEEDAAGTGDAG